MAAKTTTVEVEEIVETSTLDRKVRHGGPDM
jgi:acyl CoA:acetate/3-ketoacid CoA transferase alpha subunit